MQLVNLYTAEFRPVRTVLPLTQILLASGILILILIVLSFLMRSSANTSQLELEQAKSSLEASQAEEQDLTVQLEAQRLEDSLVRHSERLELQIEARDQLLSTLESAVIEDFPGFSSYLIGLARQVPENLWLTKILVADNGARMELEGLTSNAEAVPSYLDVLHQEPVFVGRSFSVFDLILDEENKSELRFTLQSKAAEEAQVIIANSMESLSPAETMVKSMSEVNDNE